MLVGQRAKPQRLRHNDESQHAVEMALSVEGSKQGLRLVRLEKIFVHWPGSVTMKHGAVHRDAQGLDEWGKDGSKQKRARWTC